MSAAACVAVLAAVTLTCCCRRVAAQSTLEVVVRRLLSADGRLDECSLDTSSNYTGRCHCSSLLDVHCTGLDQIPRFVANERVFSSIDMADQAITEVPQSAVDGLQVRIGRLLFSR